MAAPQIPNLNSLRRGGLRGRGRGSGTQEGWRPGESRPGQRQNTDEIIRNTDNDAATSRLSAVDAGYLDDPFARLLSMEDDIPRRLPLMNRGWFETDAWDKLTSCRHLCSNDCY
jgi:[phosphatase 2A protein]-leucine-carboxy methyltransferase